MIRKLVFIGIILFSLNGFSQDDLIKKVIGNASIDAKFNFTDKINLESTSVKMQGSAGTCWSYSGNSFLESEMIKKGKEPVDIAEVFTARYVYLSKARNYVLMEGNMRLGDGAETHDVLNVIKKYGAMPQEAYTLEDYGKGKIKSNEFQIGLEDILSKYAKSSEKHNNATWLEDVSNYIDTNLGKIPETFDYKGKKYTPQTFAKEVVGINPNDYLEFSSFSDNPFYTKIILPVADNWSFDWVYNVSAKQLTDIVDYSLSKGYTVAWSTDVSEPFFSWKNGIAYVPDVKDIYNLTSQEKASLFKYPLDEKKITDELRLQGLYTLRTTDDHGMHIVGLAKDKNGKEFYKVKNSWGTNNDFQGYIYVSKAYVQLKSTGILLNKAGVPENIKKKLL